MKLLIRIALLTVLSVGVVGLFGCEWSGGSSDNSWNDSSSIANFNGTYQPNGGYLVSEYTTSSTSTTSTGGVSNISGEDKGNVGAPSFAGQCNHTPVVPGSFHLFLTSGADGQFTDNSGGVLNGSFNVGGGAMIPATGTINYDNGAYGISLGPAGSTVVGKSIKITYSVTSSSGSTTTSDSTPGSSGVSIYAFNVQQTGNSLKIIDNNGSIYSGSLGNIRTTGNLGSTSTGATFVNGDQVSASFSASGTSKSGVHVNMTGTFQGTAAGVNQITTKSGSAVTYTTSMALSDRRMTGTWIEDGGKTGSINGYCPSAVNVSSASTSTNIAF